jgi:hypothetical protein
LELDDFNKAGKEYDASGMDLSLHFSFKTEEG